MQQKRSFASSSARTRASPGSGRRSGASVSSSGPSPRRPSPRSGRTEAVRPGPSSLGAFQIYTREVANHIVTVVGEAPPASVQRFATAVEYRQPQ